jgi:phosphoribosyl 1,2-cyclic phosphate phosphodiesterase
MPCVNLVPCYETRMLLTILGCGTSTGVPLIHCACAVCRSLHPRNKRLRQAAWLQTRGKSVLIDTSTDLRQQALREKIPRVDAVLYTHPHADHLHGIDELRSYNFAQNASIPIYGNKWTCDELRMRFPYVFEPTVVEGGGIPQLILNEFQSSTEALDILGVPVIPISLQHGSRECIGYRIDSVAYVTDCSYIPPTSLERLKGLSVLVLDCLRLEKHGTHFNLDQALELANQLRPRRTYLTHMGHEFDYTKWSKKLPRGVQLAYDGLKIRTKA